MAVSNPEHGRILLRSAELVSQLGAIRALRLAGDATHDVTEAMEAWHAARADWWGEVLRVADAGAPMSIQELQERLALSDDEVDVLIVVLAPRIDPELLDTLLGGEGNFFFRGLSVEFVLGLLFHTREERFDASGLLAPGGKLVRQGLVDLVPVGADLSPYAVELRPSEGLVDFVLERPLVSGPIAQYCELTSPVHEWDAVHLPADDKARVWQILSGTRTVQRRLDDWGYGSIMPRARGVVLLFAGPPGTGKSMFAHASAHRLGRSLLTLFTSRLLAKRDSIRPVIAEAMRIAALANAVVLMDDCEGLLDDRDERFLALLECLDRHEGILILTTNKSTSIDFAMERRIQYRLDFELPDPKLREFIWETHLPAGAPLSEGIEVATLGHAYEFSGARIRNSVLIALTHMVDSGSDQLTMEMLRGAADTQLSARFDDLAVKTTSEMDLDRLVLPDEEMGRIREVLQACRHREFVLSSWGFGKRLTTGRGLCILFDGPPGTGKTFTAELLANELKLPMYRIHIPNVVSKWVGETERNIAEIFKRARSARAVLLFDEADSLFGRRSTSSQGANDRYANMEVNLLLQEIERYDGITFLTTNLFGNLDEALQRRIQFRVTFPFPEPAERARIWQVLTPPEAPLDEDVDYRKLGGRFELAGGHIKNALLRAAYKARDAGTGIRQQHLIDACVAECQAQGKIVRAPTPKKVRVVTPD